MPQAEFAELVARLRPGGVTIAAEPAPSPILDMIFGIGADWWSETVTPDFPVSRLRSLDEWRAALEDAGFAAVEGMPLAASDTDAHLLVARTPPRRGACGRTTAIRAEAANETHTAPRVVIIHDAEGTSLDVASALAHTMERNGLAAERVVADAQTPDRIAQGADGNTHIVHLAGAFARSGRDNARVEARTAGLVDLLKALNGREARFWLVAPDAMQAIAGSRQHDPVQGAIWTFGRVALNEFPDLCLRLVDISAVLEPGEFALRLSDEIPRPLRRARDRT